MTRVAVILGSASPDTRSGARSLPNSDRGALALAMARFGGQVRAYAADPDARRFARAAGIERVEAISKCEIDSVDVALIGRGGCGDLGDALPARLAEQRGAALVYDVIDVQPQADRLVVTRDLGRGARDLLGVRGCAVLSVADSVARGPYVSRYRMNAQGLAEESSPAREGQGGGESAAREDPEPLEWRPATPRVRLGDHASRVAGRAVERMNALFGVGPTRENRASLVRGSVEDCARHLLRYLTHNGFVERGSDGEAHGASEGAVAPAPGERPASQGAAGTASIPVRARRRPHLLDGRPLAIRGPFEIGVDI